MRRPDSEVIDTTAEVDLLYCDGPQLVELVDRDQAEPVHYLAVALPQSVDGMTHAAFRLPVAAVSAFKRGKLDWLNLMMWSGADWYLAELEYRDEFTSVFLHQQECALPPAFMPDGDFRLRPVLGGKA